MEDNWAYWKIIFGVTHWRGQAHIVFLFCIGPMLNWCRRNQPCERGLGRHTKCHTNQFSTVLHDDHPAADYIKQENLHTASRDIWHHYQTSSWLWGLWCWTACSYLDCASSQATHFRTQRTLTARSSGKTILFVRLGSCFWTKVQRYIVQFLPPGWSAYHVLKVRRPS